MKKIIIIMLLAMIANINLLAQNIIDPASLFSRMSSSLTSFITRNPKGFVKGYNWGSPNAALDRNLGINTYHSYPFTSDVIDSVQIIFPPENQIIGGSGQYTLFNGMAQYLKPTIVPDSNDITYQPPYNEKTGAVFGFTITNYEFQITNYEKINFPLQFLDI